MLPSGTPPCSPPASADATGLIVEPAWLAAQRECADLRLVDVRDRADYDAGHLPGAVWLDRNTLSHSRPDRSVTLIPAAPFAALMGRLGIEAGTRVVVYDDVWGMHAARVVWALLRYGHAWAAVLSGGAEAWVGGGHFLKRTSLLPYPRTFTARPDETRRATIGWLQAHAGERSLLLLDVRGAHEYAEDHLPRAQHWEWSQGTPTGSWATIRPADELRAELRRRGITPERSIVTYCTSGMRAAHTYVLLRSLGYPRVRVLDDAWRDLAARSGVGR